MGPFSTHLVIVLYTWSGCFYMCGESGRLFHPSCLTSVVQFQFGVAFLISAYGALREGD